ncbi:hypothetical protein OBBRIDRAFT_829604 [Obba rivulosa]|uniref:Uncharacterized protein n=1 Tax=Obba rivulosa TaxID=1052685 RepID=A0A8E2DFU4_9APHY|nr:hypothetical protein OBBRIDRAFT_829604 [Obba rivulosa]
MASPLNPSAASGGGSPALPNQPASGRSNWGKNNTPGSAFRGISRGRTPRGGGRGPRGGRSASGKGPSSDRPEASGPRSNTESGKNGAPADILLARSSTLTPSVPPTSSTLPPPPNSLPSRPKPSPRKAPEPRRKASAGPSDPITPTTPNPPYTTSTRPSTRRRRSQNGGKPAAPVAPPKPAPVPEPNPSSNRAKTTHREPPPHIHVSDVTYTHGVAHDVEVLVEHVRSMAIERPHTPGSHIDWAGDEDDSLPDLDDWGITSTLTDRTSSSDKASASTKDTTISPILEDTLKPLPSLELSTAATSPASTKAADELLESVSEAPEDTPKAEKAEATEKPVSEAVPPQPDKDKPKPRRASRAKNVRRDSKSEVVDKAGNGIKEPAPEPHAPIFSGKAAEPAKSHPAETVPNTSPAKIAAQAPLHPSLPPKPTVAPAPRRNSRANQTELQSKPVPGQQPPEPKATEVASPSVALKPAVSEERPVKSTPPESVLETSIPVPSTVRSPKADERLAKSLPADHDLQSSARSPAPDARQAKSPIPGLDASSTRSSTPGHTSSHSVPDARGFHAPQTRSRTQGRRPPHFSPPGDHLDAGHAHHTRTHSMPPTGPGIAAAHSRTVHARPVLTVDAISRLARTLGGSGVGVAKREAATVSAAKN